LWVCAVPFFYLHWCHYSVNPAPIAYAYPPNELGVTPGCLAANSPPVSCYPNCASSINFSFFSLGNHPFLKCKSLPSYDFLSLRNTILESSWIEESISSWRRE